MYGGTAVPGMDHASDLIGRTSQLTADVFLRFFTAVFMKKYLRPRVPGGLKGLSPTSSLGTWVPERTESSQYSGYLGA